MARQREPKINSELAFFLKPLSAEERADLRQSIIDDGIRESVIVWEETGDIVDGHNRWDISRELKIKCPTVAKSFPNIEAVKKWMARNQTGRRNLPQETLSYLRGMEYLRKKKNADSPENSEVSDPLCHNDKVGVSTAEIIAEKHDVSPSTIIRDAKFAAGVNALPEEEKAKVLAGKSDLSKKDIIAAAPLFCDRCARIGPVKGCPKCKELGAKKTKKGPKKPKSGSEKFEWAVFRKDLGKIVRHIDLIAVGYDCRKSVNHNKAVELLGAWVNHMKVWEKELTKGA